jgi:hypothetical protein
MRVLVADGVPHGGEPVPGLLDVGNVGGLAAVRGVVEHYGVFSHQVVDVAVAVAEREALPDDRVEAEERLEGPPYRPFVLADLAIPLTAGTRY